MKRMLALLCAILMLTSVVACGKTEDPAATTTGVENDATSEATTTAATEPAETEPLRRSTLFPNRIWAVCSTFATTKTTTATLTSWQTPSTVT